MLPNKGAQAGSTEGITNSPKATNRSSEVISVVRGYIARDLLQRIDLKLNDTVRLIEEGFLTSLQTVDLVMFLQHHFQVEIDPEEVNEDNFGTLASIAALVESKLDE